MRRNPEVDAYIAAAAPFAPPILKHLRAAVHEACPEVEEAVKWSHPFFLYHGILCNMAAFKEHCSFGFWKHARIFSAADAPMAPLVEGMGQLGRITGLADLPDDAVLADLIARAVASNRAGPAAPRPRRAPRPEAEVPGDLSAALAACPRIAAAFAAFSPTQRREYVEWLTEAKTEATRTKRLGVALEQIAEGKSRHWKYQK